MRRLPVLSRGVLGIVVTLAIGCTSVESTERTPPPRVRALGTSVVFADKSDLWLWEATKDRTRRLTRNGPELAESQPRFISSGTVAFIADGALYTLGLATGTRRLVVPTRTILAYSWSPDRGTFAYVAQPGGVGPHALYLYRPDQERATVVRRFSRPKRASRSEGSDRNVDAEISVAWSASGTRILLVDTDLGPTAPTLYVFDSDGRERRRMRSVTHAGWIGETRVYYRTLQGGVWSTLDLRRGTRLRLKIALGRMHPALSPNRRFLALDSGRPWQPGSTRRRCACTLSVYDLVAGVERRLGTGLVAPLWLSRRSLAATEVRACNGAECGVDVPMWIARTGSARVAAGTGERARISLRSTLDADVLLAP